MSSETSEISQREQRINERLMATGEMDNDLTLTLRGWEVGILKEAAMDTAQTALNILGEDPSAILQAIAAQDALNKILGGFMDPFFAQCGHLIDGSENQPDIELTWTLKVSALTTFTSLVVACVVSNGIEKPDYRMPDADDTDAIVSDHQMVWWAMIHLFAQFPASVRAVLAEETGLNFEEIR